MLKRKDGSDKKESDKDDAKKSRHAEPAARASAEAAGDLLDAALAHANLTSSVVVQTLKLIDAIEATEGSYKQRMQAVADLLKADAARPASLLDLSLAPEDDEVRQNWRTAGFGPSMMATHACGFPAHPVSVPTVLRCPVLL